MAATPANALNITGAGIPIFDGTATFSSTTTTQYYTLVGDTNNAIANIATGTAGQVLTSAGNAANPAYADVPFTKLPWTDETGSYSVASNHGYLSTNTANGTLPASPANGDICGFIANTAQIHTITANTGQTIRVGKQISASAGTCKSNFIGDSIMLVYNSGTTSWVSWGAPEGTWTVT